MALDSNSHIEKGNIIKSVSSTGWVGLEEEGWGARRRCWIENKMTTATTKLQEKDSKGIVSVLF